MIGDAFKAVMSPDHNALSALPKILRFQIMAVLSVLWSIIFCLSAGVFVWLPGYVAVHIVLLLIGLFGTGWVFKVAR